MSQSQVSPAWASTAVGELLCGQSQDAVVLASTKVAAYLSVPEPVEAGCHRAVDQARRPPAHRRKRGDGRVTASRDHRARR